MPAPGERLAQDIMRQLEEHGVSDYLLVFRDPDSNSDWIESAGSLFWRMGAALDLLECTKLKRVRQELEEDGEGEVT